MPTPTEIVREMTADRFAQLLAASPKNFREELFRRAGVRVKSNSPFTLSAAPKNQVRVEKLHGALKDGLELGDETLEEVIRNYLYTRRALLADALDHFEVPHDNGLTDHELDFIEKLPPEKGAELRAKLEAKHDRADVDLYLRFMNIPGA